MMVDKHWMDSLVRTDMYLLVRSQYESSVSIFHRQVQSLRVLSWVCKWKNCAIRYTRNIISFGWLHRLLWRIAILTGPPTPPLIVIECWQIREIRGDDWIFATNYIDRWYLSVGGQCKTAATSRFNKSFLQESICIKLLVNDFPNKSGWNVRLHKARPEFSKFQSGVVT